MLRPSKAGILLQRRAVNNCIIIFSTKSLIMVGVKQIAIYETITKFDTKSNYLLFFTN